LPLVFLDFMDCADIGVIQCRGGLRFLDEPGFARLGGCQMRREKLQRDKPVEICIPGFVDDAHPTFTELFENLVMGMIEGTKGAFL